MPMLGAYVLLTVPLDQVACLFVCFCLFDRYLISSLIFFLICFPVEALARCRDPDGVEGSVVVKDCHKATCAAVTHGGQKGGVWIVSPAM